MIAAVVVTFAPPPGALDRCLAAVVDEVDLVVVVDTGGAADTGARDGVETIVTPNDGYGAAANVGFARALEQGAEIVVLLNDDVIGRPGWVAALADALAGPSVGAAQPVLVVAGTEPPLVNSVGVRIGPDGAGTDIGDGQPLATLRPPDRIELFTGGAVAIPAEFLCATGGFDRRWFLYYEDVDLARRGAALGFAVAVAADAIAEHERGATTGRQPDRTRFLQERNRLWAAFRWADTRTVARAVWLSIRRLRHPPRRIHARALAAGLAGAPGELRRRFART